MDLYYITYQVGKPRDGTSGGGVGARFSRYTVVPPDYQGAKSRRKSHQEVGYRRKLSFPRPRRSKAAILGVWPPVRWVWPGCCGVAK